MESQRGRRHVGPAILLPSSVAHVGTSVASVLQIRRRPRGIHGLLSTRQAEEIWATAIGPVRGTPSASAASAVAIAVSIVVSIAPTSSTVSSRPYRHGIALDDSAMCKPRRVHAIVGREVAANVESDQRRSLLGRRLRAVVVRSLIFSIVHADDATVSRRTSRYLI